MRIDAIKNGLVIDHITVGKAMEIVGLLKLDELDCSVAIIKNASSKKAPWQKGYNQNRRRY